MYDHVHLLVKPGYEFNISKIMKSLKENFARDANKIINNESYESETSTFRLHINNLITKYTGTINSPNFYWHHSYHDHVIRNEEDFTNHLKYINTNNLKHSLSYDWKYIGYNYPNMIDLQQIQNRN